MNRIKVIIIASLLSMFYPLFCFCQSGGSYSDNRGMPEGRCIRVLPIGIREYKKRGMDALESANILPDYDKIKIYFSHDNIEILSPIIGEVNAKTVYDTLSDLAGKVQPNDIVIIHIIGHGTIDKDGVYQLICSDEDLSEKDICQKLKYMVKQGVLVIIFLDTCYSGALLDKGISIEGEGAIAFFASSSNKEPSPEKSQDSPFSKLIIGTLKNENPGVYTTTDSILTLGSLEKFIGRNVKPKPYIRYFTKNGSQTYKGLNISSYPLFKKPSIKTPPVVQNPPFPPKQKNNRFYGGIAIGTNHTPTPFGDINIGFDLKHIRVEAGASFAFTLSEDVYIYNTNGILQNAYNYRGCNFYGRIGYDIMSCFKEKSRWEIVPLVGISGNYIAGKQQDGFNGDIGKDATSLMFTTNCRFAYDLTNKGRFYLQGTIGCDFALDNNTKVLGESKYIKNWCKSRPNIEIGLIFKTKSF